MSDKPFNVLFICTGNSARSIMAEGILNQLGAGRFKAYSAGSLPKGAVHPMALDVLVRMGASTVDCSSKGWEVFGQPGAPEMNLVFTVCDDAAGEVCPVWPGHPTTAHWGVNDPVAFQGPAHEQQHAFNEVAQILKRRIELMLALPEESLASMSIQSQLNAIGKT